LVMTAISLAPDAASSVIAVCRRSWNGRTLSLMPAAFSAAANCGVQISFQYDVPRCGWQKTSSPSPLNAVRW
jgi:hypothetical protein